MHFQLFKEVDAVPASGMISTSRAGSRALEVFMTQENQRPRSPREIADHLSRAPDDVNPITSPPARMLNSWKEIAAYLQRGVRTVQRWEQGLALPVHGIGTGKRSPVFAHPTELNFWLGTAGLDRSSKIPRVESAPIPGSRNSQLQSLRELRAKMHNLSHTVAETSVRQRVQAELAKERLLQLRSRMKPAS